MIYYRVRQKKVVRSFSMISGQFACSHSCVTRAVCAEAPSCWKMNPAGINCLQSSISLISILCTGTHELLLLLRIPVHAAFACDTFPIFTALTKCWLLTSILPKYRVLYLDIRLPDDLRRCNVTDDVAFTLVLSFFVSNNNCYNQ